MDPSHHVILNPRHQLKYVDIANVHETGKIIYYKIITIINKNELITNNLKQTCFSNKKC